VAPTYITCDPNAECKNAQCVCRTDYYHTGSGCARTRNVLVASRPRA